MCKKTFVTRFVIILIIFLIGQTVYSQSGAWGQHTYEVVSAAGITWEDAKSAVENSDYYLATITSQEEEDFIISLLQDNEFTGEYWLGGYQSDPTAAPAETWKWVTGEEFCYTDWASIEPNDYAGLPEIYLAIWDYPDYGGFKWNDEGEVGNIAGYIIETGNTLIDIKPGSDPNSISCKNGKGVIPVAILTTDCFDAATVDHTTVTFQGAGEAHVNKKSGVHKRHEEDVDGDGDIDLIFHFKKGDTDLNCNSEVGTLTGETFDGIAIYGQDNVNMIKGNLDKSIASETLVINSDDYALIGNYPNPFNPETQITFQIPESEFVTVRIFNSLGKEIRELTSRQYEAGYHAISWNGKDNTGVTVPSGLYIVHLQAGIFSQAGKMTLLK